MCNKKSGKAIIEIRITPSIHAPKFAQFADFTSLVDSKYFVGFCKSQISTAIGNKTTKAKLTKGRKSL